MRLTGKEEREWVNRVHELYVEAARLHQEAVREDNAYREYMQGKYRVPLMSVRDDV